MNNLPSIQFDGVDDYISFPSSMISSLSVGVIFIVIKIDNDPPAAGKIGLWDFDQSGNGTLFPGTDGVIRNDFGSNTIHTTVNPTVDLTNPVIYSVVNKTGEWTSRLNGSQIFTTSSNTEAFAGIPSIGLDPFNNAYLDGNVGEVIFYDRALSIIEIEQIEEYLSKKWKIDLD